jgi:hypothetical protein
LFKIEKERERVMNGPERYHWWCHLNWGFLPLLLLLLLLLLLENWRPVQGQTFVAWQYLMRAENMGC